MPIRNIYQGRRARIFLAPPSDDAGVISFFSPPEPDNRIATWLTKQATREVVRALNAFAYT